MKMIMMRAAVLTGAMLAAGPVAAQDTKNSMSPDTTGDDAGQVAFNTHCRNCHSVKEGDNRLGPTLHGIHGKPAGQVKGFGNYSGGLTADMKWDDATLDKFIATPTAMVPNTTMKPFGGVEDAEQRKLIIDFLKKQS